MARPSNADLISRVRELEARIADAGQGAGQTEGIAMPHKVRGLLKDIIRHPERAVALAEEALRSL